jgi:hypothetical protein
MKRQFGVHVEVTPYLYQNRLQICCLFFDFFLCWHVDCGMEFMNDLCKVKYMPRFIILFACLFLLSLGACDKSQKHFKLDPVFRQYFDFPNGSSWDYVALNDTTDKETVVAKDFLEGKIFWDALDQEFIQVDLHSNKDSIYKLRVIADDNNTNRASLFVKDTFFKTTMEWYTAFGIMAGVKGSGDSFTLHPSYTVRGKTYSNVMELRPLQSIEYIKLFVAPNVGVIRKDLVSGKSYVLKSYSLQ